VLLLLLYRVVWSWNASEVEWVDLQAVVRRFQSGHVEVAGEAVGRRGWVAQHLGVDSAVAVDAAERSIKVHKCVETMPVFSRFHPAVVERVLRERGASYVASHLNCCNRISTGRSLASELQGRLSRRRST